MKLKVLAIAICLFGLSYAHAQTITWTGAGDGINWGDASNWNLDQVPGSANDVIIPSGFNTVINVGINVNSIALNANSQITLTSTLVITGQFDLLSNSTLEWTTGALQSGTINNNGRISISSSGSKTISSGLILNNNNTLTISDTGTLFINDGTINNTGTFALESDATIQTSGSGGVINNLPGGTLVRSNSTGVFTIAFPFNNENGTVQVQSGTLSFTQPLTMDRGAYEIETGAFLRSNNRTILSGQINSNPEGELILTAPVEVVDTATVNFGDAGISITDNATITGGGVLINTNNFNVIGTGSKTLTGNSKLINRGVMNWLGTGTLFINEADIDNEGLIDLQVDATIQTSGAGGLLTNKAGGILRRSSSTGIFTMAFPVDNENGTVEVQSGALTFTQPLTIDRGSYDISVGAFLRSTNRTQLTGDINSDLNGSLILTNTVEVLDTATVNFGQSGLNLSDNTSITGGGLLINTGVANIIDNGSKTLSGGVRLLNRGTLNWLGTGTTFVNNAIIDNESLIDLQVDARLQTSGSGGVVNNLETGTLRKSIEAGTFIMAFPFNNENGTIDILSGTVTFTQPLTMDRGTYDIAEGAFMLSNSRTNLVGEINSDPVGDLVLVNTVEVLGTANVNFGNAGLNISDNATINGGGVLINDNIINIINGGSKTLSGNTRILNRDVMNWLGTGTLFINNGFIDNEGLIDLQIDATIQTSGSGGVINNKENGIVRRSSSAGNFSMNFPFNNENGTIQVESGTLTFSQPLTMDRGTYEIAQDATLRSNNRTTLIDDINSNPIGDLILTSIVEVTDTATVNLGNGGLKISDNTTINGGGVIFNANEFNIIGIGSKTITGGITLVNQGNLNWSGRGTVFVNQATINNEGLIDLQVDATLQTSGAGGILNNNAGAILRKSAGTGQFAIAFAYSNKDQGVVEVQSGTLRFTTSFDSEGGNYAVDEEATLWSSSTTTLAGEAIGDLDGNFVLSGTVTIADTAIMSLTGSGLDLTDNTTITGGGVLINDQVLNIVDNGSKTLNLGTKVLNRETMNWTGTGAFFVNNGIIENEGLLDWQNNSIMQVSGAGGDVLNSGVFRKSTIEGTSTVTLRFENQADGIIDVQTGTLNFTNNFQNLDQAGVQGTGTIDLPFTNQYTNSGFFAPGTSPGTLTVLGDFVMEDDAFLKLELDGLVPDTEHDVLAIDGDAVLTGDIVVSVGYQAQVGDEYTVLTTTGTITTCNLPATVTSSNVFNNFRFMLEVECNTSTVVLRIIEVIELFPPTADNDEATVDQAGNIVINLIDGDTDSDGTIDPMSIAIVQTPLNGTITNNNDGTVTYMHDGSDVDSDSFSYTVRDNDSLLSNEAIVSIDIFIEPEPQPEPVIEIFNAVSPNGDERNDFFEIRNIELFQNNSLMIFNRWGDRVYEATGYNNDTVRFEGISNVGNGNELPDGTYFYQLNLGDGSDVREGFLVLRR
ncbi:MAG: gliding motility-associated C-terminal domain-containing protein [Bacteroidota bacterium]